MISINFIKYIYIEGKIVLLELVKGFDKTKYINKFVENLPILRVKLNLTQEQLAKKASISRQTVVAIENKKRKMTWSNFLALLMIFYSNDTTKYLLLVLEIYTDELQYFLTSTEKSKVSNN